MFYQKYCQAFFFKTGRSSATIQNNPPHTIVNSDEHRDFGIERIITVCSTYRPVLERSSAHPDMKLFPLAICSSLKNLSNGTSSTA